MSSFHAYNHLGLPSRPCQQESRAGYSPFIGRRDAAHDGFHPARDARLSPIASPKSTAGTMPNTAADAKKSGRMPIPAATAPPKRGPVPNPSEDAAPMRPNAVPFAFFGLETAASAPTRPESPPKANVARDRKTRRDAKLLARPCGTIKTEVKRIEAASKGLSPVRRCKRAKA